MAGSMNFLKNKLFGSSEAQYDDEYFDGYEEEAYDDGAYNRGSGEYDNGYYESEYDDEYSSSYREKSTPKKSFKSYVGGKSKAKTTRTTQPERVTPNKDWELIVKTPLEFDDSFEISDYIKEGKAVVVNFNKVSTNMAQRIMDCLAGTCCSLDGEIEQVDATIFIISPMNVGVYSDSEENTRRNSRYDDFPKMNYGR